MLLNSGEAQVEINTEGAYVDFWRVGEKDIFYPKNQLTVEGGNKKTRGGCHVCLPNFDNGDKYDLPHHGYGRLAEWRIISESRLSVALEINSSGSVVPDRYKQLKTRLIYVLEDEQISMLLWVKNMGKTNLELDPAFHPYFKNDSPFYELSQTRLPITLVWSDNSDSYFCVEPTANGRSFKDGTPKVIKPGEEKSYNLTIRVFN
ncbi:MAG: hypothetical protein LBL84_01915 [Candidatus Nomurabacteria bacterium]|nr:hypothetical protein [Candidatus Nomurabacteria bacterium]